MIKDGPHDWFSMDERIPPTDLPIVVERLDGKRDQVTMRNGQAFEWRYQDTDNVFAGIDDIKYWRSCSGFDF
jgi:hypothetical protein